MRAKVFRGFLLALVGVTAACGTANGETPESDRAASSSGQWMEQIRNISSGASRIAPWYRTLDEALPNVRYKRDSKKAVPASEVVVIGTVDEVLPGRAFVQNIDKNDSVKEVEFTSPDPSWRTAHLVVRVDREFGETRSKKKVDDITVGLNIGLTPLAEIAKGFEDLGTLVLFLQPDCSQFDQDGVDISAPCTPVFSYDPSLYGVLEDGGLVAVVDDASGDLTLPFVEAHRAEELLKATRNIRDLERKGNEERREVKLKRQGGHYVNE